MKTSQSIDPIRMPRLAGIVSLMFWLMAGCSSPVSPGANPGSLQVALSFPTSSKASGAVTDIVDLDRIHITVFNSISGREPIFLTEKTLGATPSGTTLNLSLSVPTASQYTIRVEAMGVGRRADLPTFTRPGLQYFGQASVSLGLATATPVTITMFDVVPQVSIDYGYYPSYSDSLSWDSVPFATGYSVRDSFNLLASGIPDTYLVIPYTGSAIHYRVRAELPYGLVSAYSEALPASNPD